MRNADPDLPRGHLFKGVRFVEDQEVVREKVAFIAFLLLFQSAEQHEEQGVINHHHVGREQPPARLLEETTRILSAGLRGADVRFAANLCPDLWIGLERQIAQRAVDRCARPVGEPGEIALLGRVEKFVRTLHRALQPARTKIILPAFHECGLELDRQNLFHDRDVLVQQLFLEVDRVGRNDRLLLFLDREKGRRNEVGKRFAYAGPGLYYEVALFLQRLRDGRRHRLLLRPILKVTRPGEQAVLGKNRPHSLDKIAPERIFERDHG